jgi:hypothetical protein
MIVGKNRRILGLFLACTVVGWFGMVASPVFAHTPPDNNANFNPDEFNGDGVPQGDATPTVGAVKEAEIIADAEDGFGTAYELRAVADSQTAFYEWYNCTQAANPAVPGAACQPIASDTTPDAAPTPPGEGTAAAFSGSYNVPSTSETDALLIADAVGPGGIRDIYGIACNSDATAGGPPFNTSHCLPNDVSAGAPVEPAAPGGCALATTPNSCVADIHLDDSQTTTPGHAATTNGRIQALVTASKTFIGDEIHGAGLKNGDTLTAIAFTSAGGVDAVQICMDQGSDDETGNDDPPTQTGGAVPVPRAGCTHSGTDTSPTPGGGAACNAAAPVAPGGDCWAVTIGVPNANNVFGVSLIEYNDLDNTEGATFGTGDCQGAFVSTNGDDCQLDKVYVTTTLAGEGVAPPPPTPVPTPPTPPARNCPAGFKALRGTPGNDKIRGTSDCDKIRGLGGDDNISGKAGDDVLIGGRGDDLLNGRSGNDKCVIKRSDQDKVKGCEEIVRKR